MLKVLRTAGPAPLRPAETLDDLPEIARRAEMTGLAVELSCEELGDVSAGAQLTIGAVVREALDNAARHAGPGARTYLLLESLDDGVVVTVRDDGVGIAPGRLQQAASEGRLGISQSIVGRLNALAGSAQLTTDPGAGTEWELTVPRG